MPKVVDLSPERRTFLLVLRASTFTTMLGLLTVVLVTVAPESATWRYRWSGYRIWMELSDKCLLICCATSLLLVYDLGVHADDTTGSEKSESTAQPLGTSDQETKNRFMSEKHKLTRTLNPRRLLVLNLVQFVLYALVPQLAVGF